MSSTTVPMLGGFSHTQTTASVTWTITHGLNTLCPVIDCWTTNNGSLTKILPVSVDAIDVSTVQLTFSTARDGVAYVI